MTKKDFKAGVNPATLFINTQAEPEAPEVVQTTKKEETMPAVKQDAGKEVKKEAKTKRLNLLLQPSLMEDLTKLAFMNKDSVNNLINTALTGYRDAHKDLIDKYNKVFEG